MTKSNQKPVFYWQTMTVNISHKILAENMLHFSKTPNSIHFKSPNYQNNMFTIFIKYSPQEDVKVCQQLGHMGNVVEGQ